MTEQQQIQYALPNPPSDTISTVSFSPKDPNSLLVAGWDSRVSLYTNVSASQSAKPPISWSHEKPVLDVCWHSNDTTKAFSCGIDRTIKLCDLSTGLTTTIGNHDDAIKAVRHIPQNDQVVSGSWDKTLRVWDVRSPTTNCASKSILPHKVYSMDVATSKNLLVVAMAERLVHIYDTRKISEPLQRRESSLKYMTRIVRCMPDGEGYVSASVEGRVAVEWIDPSPETQTKKFAFKCHRATVDGVDYVYPVNAIAFHPRWGTFASGGSDGVVNIWDGWAKKRIRQYPKYPTGINSLSFNCDGSLLAIASSYSYDEGEKDHPPDEVFIRTIGENECKPKNVNN